MITTGKIGDTLRITGSNIFDISSVTFAGGASGSFDEVNDEIYVNVPLGVAWGPMTMTSSIREQTGVSSFFFAPEPIITGFVPATGLPGSTITINGYAMSGITGVTFNNLPATSVNVISNSGLTAVLPTGNTRGYIKITGASGLYFTSTQIFSPHCQITGVTPLIVRTGTAVTISGSNFLPQLMYSDPSRSNYYFVSFNGATGSFELLSSIRLTGAVPNDASTGPVNITQSINNYYPSNFSVTVLPSIPVVTLATPASGKFNDAITLQGANFNTVTKIRLQQNSTTNAYRRADVFVDMEYTGATGTVITPAIMSGVTKGSAVGTWQTTGLSNLKIFSDSGERQLQNAIIVTGASYDDSGATRSLGMSGTKDTEYIRYVFNTGQANVSVGFYLTLGNFDGSLFASYDFVQMDGGGEFNVLNFQDWPTTQMVIQAHVLSGVSATPVKVVPNKTYWVSMFFNSGNSGAGVYIYDPTTWVLSGTSFANHSTSQNVAEIRFGRCDSHGVGHLTSNKHYYDDIIINLTGEFPVLPGNTGTNTILSSNYVDITTGNFKVSSLQNVAYFNVPTGMLEGKCNIIVVASGGSGTGSGILHIKQSPTITGFFPVYGQTAEVLRISGTNLYYDSKVYFNSNESAQIKQITGSDDNTYYDIEIPGQSSLENTIIFDNLVGITSTGLFTFVQNPGISGFYPTSGTWGSTINLSGTGFRSVLNVFLNNSQLTGFTAIGDTGISFTIPNDTYDSYIKVNNRYASSYSSSAINVIPPAMTITGLTPNPIFIENNLTISGVNLRYATGVMFSGGFGSFSTKNFTINSGNEIIVKVPTNAISQKIGVLSETGVFYSSNILTIIGAPTVTGIYPVYQQYNGLITISGTNFTGTEFYFTKYDGSLVKGSGTVITSSILATTSIPKPIITNFIAMSGGGKFYDSPVIFYPLPTINALFTSTGTGSNIGDRIEIEVFNGHEITGILMSGSGVHRNIIDDYTDLRFRSNLTSNSGLYVTGCLNGEFFGTGFLYPIFSGWTGVENRPIPNEFTGMKFSTGFRITGGSIIISGVGAVNGAYAIPYNQIFYLSGRNLRMATHIFFSGVSEPGQLGLVKYTGVINHKLITGELGNSDGDTHPILSAKVYASRSTGAFGFGVSVDSSTSPNQFMHLHDMRFSYFSKPLQGDKIFTGTNITVSGTHFQGFPAFGYGAAYLRDSFTSGIGIPVYITNRSSDLYNTDSQNLEYISFNIPENITLTDRNFNLYFINSGLGTGIITGIKISNKADVDNLNTLETKIYTFS